MKGVSIDKCLATLIFIGCIVWSTFVVGAELTHKWKSPSFSGVGTSAHFLTIENQEFTRKAEIKAKRDSEEAKKYQQQRIRIMQNL